MPCVQSVCRVGFAFSGMRPLSNCVDLKETLVSLKQFKVSDEMSRKFVLSFKQFVDTFFLTFVVRISLTVYASVPLHAVFASVPLREQTCHVCFEVAIEILHSPQLPRKFLMTVVVKEDGLGDGYGEGSSCCQ